MAERINLDIVKTEVGNLLSKKDEIRKIIQLLDSDMELVNNTDSAQRALGGNIGTIKKKWSDFKSAYDTFSASMSAIAESLEGNTGSVNANSETMQNSMASGASETA